MRPSDARLMHSALAHALLGVWLACPRAQQLIQAEIEGWPLRTAVSVEDYLPLISDRLRSSGMERSAIDALGDVGNELLHVDEYLKYMFDSAIVLVRECYQSWAEWEVPSVYLEVASAVNPIYPDQPNFGELGVVACVPPREGTDPAIVKLTFVPSLLGPPSWATVPYLLCHELVCHANQVAPMDSADPFAEGWMDYVAWRLHNQWVDQLFPWAPALARAAARRLSEGVLQRWRGLEEPHLTARAARCQGRAAAEFVEEKLRPFNDGRPVSPLIRLSLQLNRVSPTQPGRAEFVAKVLACMSDPRLQAHLLVKLRRWLDRGELAEQVLSFE